MPISTGDEIEERANYICENIYQFTLIFHVAVNLSDGTPSTVRVALGQNDDHSTDIFKVHGSGLYLDSGVLGPDSSDSGGGPITNEQILAGKLSAVEVSLTVLTDFGIEQMRKRTFTGSDLDEFVAQNSYQFSKLIPVPGS